MTKSRLAVTRAQILAFRRRVGALDERLPAGAASLQRAAWAGLQDSAPRAALLSIHARVAGTEPSTWEDPALVQVWGPRFSVYVIAAADLAVFTLGRLPDDPKGRQFAEETALRLDKWLAGRRMPYGDAGHALGMHPNALRYAAPTGTVLMRWDGARQPVVWTVPRPEIDPLEARLELARRFVHIFGPTTPASFAQWAGISPSAAGTRAFESLGRELTRVVTPIGERWILAEDEPAFRAAPSPAAPTRLLPSGDSYTLLKGSDRELLLPDPHTRARLWTPRVWPGALLVRGEVVGIWRRSGRHVTIELWPTLSAAEREAVEVEAHSLPLPGGSRRVDVRWGEVT